MYRNLTPDENNAAVRLVAIDGTFIANAAIPKSKIGITLSLDGRVFMWSKSQSAYLEVPSVILAHEQPPTKVVLH